MVLGPFDEVRHDQEIAGETHLLDDPDLPFEAGPVVGLGRDRGYGLQPRLQPLAGLMHQFLGLGPPGPGLETRQDRRPRGHQEGAAARNLHRRVAGLGQVGEQLAHRCRRLEPVFAGHTPPILLTGKGPVGDTHQGVVGFRLRSPGVVNVIRGDQRNVMGIGPFHQPALRLLLTGQTVTLQFDIEAVAEHPRHLVQRCIRLGRLALHKQRVDRTVGPAGKQDQPFGPFRHHRPGHARLIHRACVEKGRGRQGAQVQPTGLILRQQDHGRHPRPAVADLAADAGDRKRAGHDRLNAGPLGRFRKLQSPEQIGPVGHAHRRHAGIRRQGRHLARLDRAFQQRIGRADPQVNELRGCGCVGNGQTLFELAHPRLMRSETPPATPSRRSRCTTQATAYLSSNAP